MPKHGRQVLFVAIYLGVPLFPCAFPAQPSTVVMIWTPDVVALGSDGRVTRQNNALSLPIYQTCKIRAANGYQFSAVGLYSSERTGFNLWRTLADSASKAGSVREAADIAAQKVRAEVERFLAAMNLAEKAEYERHVNGTYAGFVFVGNDATGLHMSARQVVREVGTIVIDQAEYPRGNPEDSFGLLLMGERDAIDFQIAMDRSLLAGEPANVAKRLVDVEINGSSEKVGPPVAVVRVTTEGAEWIERGACAAEP